MTGIKGQKWSTEKRRPFKKINITLPVEIAEYWEKKALEQNKTVSKLYREILVNKKA